LPSIWLDALRGLWAGLVGYFLPSARGDNPGVVLVNHDEFVERFKPLVTNVARPKYAVEFSDGSAYKVWGDDVYVNMVPTPSGMVVVFDSDPTDG
jgi:hypothetical protein